MTKWIKPNRLERVQLKICWRATQRNFGYRGWSNQIEVPERSSLRESRNSKEMKENIFPFEAAWWTSQWIQQKGISRNLENKSFKGCLCQAGNQKEREERKRRPHSSPWSQSRDRGQQKQECSKRHHPSWKRWCHLVQTAITWLQKSWLWYNSKSPISGK